MIQITLVNIELGVGSSPDGLMRVITATDKQSGITVVIPVDRLTAINFGRSLSTGLSIGADDPQKPA